MNVYNESDLKLLRTQREQGYTLIYESEIKAVKSQLVIVRKNRKYTCLKYTRFMGWHVFECRIDVAIKYAIEWLSFESRSLGYQEGEINARSRR